MEWGQAWPVVWSTDRASRRGCDFKHLQRALRPTLGLVVSLWDAQPGAYPSAGKRPDEPRPQLSGRDDVVEGAAERRLVRTRYGPHYGAKMQPSV